MMENASFYVHLDSNNSIIAVDAWRASSLLCVPVDTIKKWAESDFIPCIKKDGKTIFPVDALRKWANEYPDCRAISNDQY